MISQLRTIWEVLKHTFTSAETVQYPEEKPYLAPRYRGRIVLTRDPRWRGALRGLQPLCCGLPGRLHCIAKRYTG